MRVPLKWLAEFVQLDHPADEIASQLTMIGHEVEAVERLNDDVVFEVNVTPNRPDCLSIIGIARELSAIYKTPLKFPEHDLVADSGDLNFNVDIIDIPLCHRYAGRVVKNLEIGPSPDWLKNRLEQCGVRSINNVVDITNYVLLELGHPLHAFDLSTIKGHYIRIGTPRSVRGQGSSIGVKTLDGVVREIPAESLLIWDAEDPIAIAGVMGGSETEVRESTRDIFIESAYFDPISIRRTSKALGLKTESSYRFERGTDIKLLKKALDRTAYLVNKLCGGTINGKIDIYPKRHAPVEISVNYERVNRTLGLSLNGKEMLHCIEGLGLEIIDFADHFVVKPPTYRMDIKREADIVEEIARIYGYDRIPATLPKVSIGSVPSERFSSARTVGEIKESFEKAGFTEVINYSFMGPEDLDLLHIKDDDLRRNAVRIKNPLRAEDSLMRTTLAPALIRNVLHNLAHGNRELRLFEVSKVFLGPEPSTNEPQTSLLPTEILYLGAVYYKEKIKSLYRDDTLDFYIIKGIIDNVLNALRIGDFSFVRSSEPFLHPGQSCDILISGTKVGYCGLISPEITDSLNLRAQTPSLIVMELDLDGLIPYTMQVLKYMPLPRYPFIERDSAILVSSALESSLIMGWVKSYPSELIEDSYIFDVYKGEHIPEGKKSIAFNVRYRSSERTLKDEEIDALHQNIVAFVLSKSEGQLRQ